jgi:hypothetical protein
MLSRAQEARVQAILWSSPPGTIQTYCLEPSCKRADQVIE